MSGVIGSAGEGPVRLLALPLEGEALEVLAGLEETLASLEAQPDVRALVLELDGDPPLELESSSASETVEHARRVQELLSRLRAPARPVVAAVSGRLEAAGCALAWATHAVVAGEGAWLLPRELERGRLTGFGAFQRLSRRVGAERAAALVLLGEPLSAGAAFDAGLVDVVVPAGEHVRAAQAVAERCAEREPAALASVLELLDAGAGLALEDALELEAQHAGLVRARRGGG